MRLWGPGMCLLFCMMAVMGRRGVTDAQIRVDAGKVLNRITPLMYGACIEDVNHEIYGGLYAQRIFGESFEEPPQGSPVAGFTAYGGAWSQIPDGVSVDSDPGAKLVRDAPAISDGRVECEVKLSAGDNAGLILRVNDPRTGADSWIGYEVSLSAGGHYVRLGRHRNDWTHFKDAPADVKPDAWNRLRVLMEGPRIRVFLGDSAAPLLDYTDSESPVLAGKVGVRTWNARASFRNLRITADGSTVEGFARQSAAADSDSVSGMWDPVRSGTAQARYVWDADNPFNSAHSQRIEFLGGEGTAGLVNRGLNRWGIAVRRGRRMAGRLYLRGTYAGRVTVALQSADGSRTYAAGHVGPVGPVWRRCEVSLTPSADDENARFALWIDRPGTVWVDQVYLSDTGAALFRGLPIRADIARMLQREGLKVLRYGGSMVNSPEYRWKEMIGDPDRRPQYHGTWYPFSTNGFGIEDFVRFCRAAGFEPIFAINIEETPQDAADLVEYLNGPTSSKWGALRVRNGHPEPYGVRYIEIGNEEKTDAHYVERFRLLAPAMHARDAKLQLIIAAWWEPDNPVSKRIVQELNGQAALWDVHVGGDDPREGANVDRLFTRMERLVQDWAPGTNLKACVLEENGGRHDLQRALGHAGILNATQRHGDFVVIDCPANCLQPWQQNDNGWDQGQVFFTPGRVWGMPPFYAQQMAAANHFPLRVESSVADADLDVAVTRSEDGKTLVLQVVNAEAEPQSTEIDLAGFHPARADAWVLSGALADVNPPDAPDRIRSHKAEIQVAGPQFTHTFLPHSYTVLRLDVRGAAR